MLSDLKEKLAALAVAVNNSVATVAAERIEKAKARAAEMRAKAEEVREQKYLLDALPGNDEKEVKEKRLEEIEVAMAEYQEICNLLHEADAELLRAKKAAPAERDQLVAAAKAVVDEVRAEKERIETDPDVAFFGWLRQLESHTTENPDHRLAVALINGAIAKGLIEEIDGDTARARQEAAKKAKEEKGHQNYEERQAPFFWVRVKPHGGTPQGEQEPDSHFRYISGGVDFYAHSSEGARKRLAFFALQEMWKACTEAKKAAYKAAQDVKQHSYLSLVEIAAGQTGQAWAEVTAERPWEPTFFNRATQKVEKLMKDGKEVVNYGPVVVESPRPGVLRVLNAVHSGMFHPLRLAGAWEEQEDGKFTPVDFKFFPDSGSFAGLRPVVDDGSLPPGKLGRLRAILCLAGGLQATVKEEERTNGGATEAPPEGNPRTRRGYRVDGSKAGEPRKGKGKRFKSRDDDYSED